MGFNMQRDKLNSASKKTILQKTGKNMFVWVTIASIACSVSIVFSIILIQRIFFINTLIDEKNKTLKTLSSNNDAIPKLQNSVRALNSNQELINAKARESDDPVQVVLDALPTEPNYPALGASFQQVLLNNRPGIKILGLTVNQTATGSGSSNQSTKHPGLYEMPFSFSAQGNTASLINLLTYLEKSIRVVDTKTLSISSSGDEQLLSISGVAYYQPPKTIEVKTKEIKQ